MNTFLLVEDDENDVLFFQTAWKRAGIPNPLRVVHDGQQAVDYLAGAGVFSNRGEYPLPCLVLLDLNLPHKSGFEVLEWIRSDAALCTVLVVVLSSSNADRDVQRAYLLGANSYVVKPTSPEQLRDLASLLRSYWLEWNFVPPQCERASTQRLAMDESK